MDKYSNSNSWHISGDKIDSSRELVPVSDALCPTCKQPLPRDATTFDPRGGAKLKCAFCPKPAKFIIRKTAVCFDHRNDAKLSP